MYTELAAVGCLVWYVFIVLVSAIGTIQIFRHYSRPPRRPVSSHLERDDVPHVTIIRPCMGLEPYLYECLAATFHQDYPIDKLTVSFCVSSKEDAAYPVIVQLLEHYPEHDAQVYVEEEDVDLCSERGTDIGPNPKIRNMSQAYRKAKGDIVWILDCNIWVGQGTCGRMVDKLCGFAPKGQRQRRPYKLVAHLPVCVSVDNLSLSSSHAKKANASGGLLEQSFLSTAHAKMYVAINSVAVAPCINGKSTIFRRSHLDYLTDGHGIDFFGQNICEDHLIGDLLWRSYLPPRLAFSDCSPRTKGRNQLGEEDTQKSNPCSLRYKNHGLALNDLAIQPIANMSLSSYIARRVRWLRVRKFTVPVATLVEPGTESLLCSLMGAWGATTSQSTNQFFGYSWSWCLLWCLLSVCIWSCVDYSVFTVLQSGGSIEQPTVKIRPTTSGTVSTSTSTRQNKQQQPRQNGTVISGSTKTTARYLTHHTGNDSNENEDQSTAKPAGPEPGAPVPLPPFASNPSTRSERSKEQSKIAHRQQSQHLSSSLSSFHHRHAISTWLIAWLSREILAFPVWTWAIWGGTTVTWREQRFWVGMDMKVYQVVVPDSRAKS